MFEFTRAGCGLASRVLRVINGKGGKNRVAPIPIHCVELLQQQMDRVHQQHQTDLASGLGAASLPPSLGAEVSVLC